MSTVTSHTLFSRAARYSGGATSLGCPKPAVVSLPFARNSGKKTPRSLCYYADPKSLDHPSNIPSVALLHNPVTVMPSTPTTTEFWKISEDDRKVELTLFHMPDKAKPEHFQVAVEGDVLVIRKPAEPNPPNDISLHVRLLVPEFYVKDKIKAVLDRRNLVVIIPKYRKDVEVEEKKEG